jgi:WD40 repeat protein/serine/threonine protein kinase
MSEPGPAGETRAAQTQAGDDLLAELADDFLRRHRAGERPGMDQYCAKHPDLTGRIRELFPAMLAMEQPGLGAALDLAPPAERIGAIIGRYKLLERIGEGGFGVVYMAEQHHPVRRKVGLKVIKPGFDTRQVIARFEAERQALALMNHENIAKVLDAGATESGRPYFVMELVHGVPITDYCENNQLPPRERLGLFVQVCRAVQHAHTKGIIHRDIKPTNVLVTLHDGLPVPKVIDFGVAKATGQQLTDKTLFTNFQQMVGTPLYMSPEQAEMTGVDVDTRSDVYSLGVLLYELLTGTTPLDKQRLKQATFDEVRRIIREEEPPKPSTRLSTMGQQTRSVSATQRKSDPRQLGRLMRGELDWIVMKALEKDRARRYETASGLAMDVQRYMNYEPVLARSPSATYKFRKFVRRNRGPVTAAAALLLVLCLGLVGTSLGLVKARKEALLARSAEDAATRDRDSANAARRREAEARLDEQRLNFHMAFDRGLALCDQGQVGTGMLWLARALKLAPRDEVAIERVIRANLTAWGRELHTLQAIYPYKQGASTGAISPDGTLVLTGAIDGVVHLWDRRTGKGREVGRHYAEVHEAAFSPDGNTFLTASVDKTARLWDTNSGHTIREFRHGSAVWGAVFTREGRIITSSSEGEIQVWDADSENAISAWRNTTHGSVHQISLSPDGKQVLGACENDGVVLLWDLQTQRVVARFAGHTGRIPTVAFVGPKRIASADTDGNVFLWTWPQADTTVDGQRIGEAWRHRGGVHRLRVSQSGDELITASYDNTAQLLNSLTGEPIGVPFEHQGGLKCVAFSHDGLVLTACEDDGAREWRPAPGSLLRSPFVHDAGTKQTLYTPDAKYVLTRKDTSASIRRALTGEQVGMPFEPGGGVHGFAISPDESKVMTGAAGGKVQFWHTATGLPFGESFKHRGGAWAVAISSDGERAVSGGLDGGVTLWSVRTGRPLRIFPALGNASIRGVAISSDGSRVAVATADKLAWVLGTAEGDVPRKLEGHHGSVMTVVFSHDNKYVATGSWDKTVIVWDADTGKEVSRPMRHGGPFWYAVAFSKDGRSIVAGCDDHTARIWDIATARPVGPRLPHEAAPRTAAFTENDARIITGTSAGTTRIWDVSRSPLEGDVESIELWLQVSTGMELAANGEVRPLDPESWQRRRERLNVMSNKPVTGPASPGRTAGAPALVTAPFWRRRPQPQGSGHTCHLACLTGEPQVGDTGDATTGANGRSALTEMLFPVKVP